MISIILGTRPEIIKMAPVIRACQKKNIPYSVLHTGQHYSYDMDRIFFEELELPRPEHNLDAGSGSHAEQTGKIMTGIEKILLETPPDIVLVQGDTNTVLAGALAATKLHVPVGHVEAGLRSFDRSMPEEINRIVADHIADYLFAPTDQSRQYLLREGIDEQKIFVTGNTVVDAVYENREIAKRKPAVLNGRGLTSKEYFLVTAHRAENVDVKSGLDGIIQGLASVHETYGIPVIFPMHPRTQKMMKEFGIDSHGITITPPVGYMEFLELEANANLVLTDSGGIQEEACILGVPCVTLRNNTERPETIDVGANMLAGTDPGAISRAAATMLKASRTWKNPYGDGHAGERIAEFCAGTGH
ncbi:MAG: UDP-N-acetylglucosamine 2-epimerase (non-hydrolyzing) [Methanoregula sp.]|jgi:UDP-N-acetylglucosamine 2-epimerase (non-hydrolysing)